MKSTITILAFILFGLGSFAQKISSNEILIRHDTTILKAEECLWLLKSMPKSVESEKSVPLIILEGIQRGEIMGFDPHSALPIPSNKIFTWQLSSDTVAYIDSNEKVQYKVVQQERNPDYITRIDIYQDWYLDVSTGKLKSIISAIDLVEEVRIPATGDFIGFHTFCRIKY